MRHTSLVIEATQFEALQIPRRRACARQTVAPHNGICIINTYTMINWPFRVAISEANNTWATID